MKLKLAVATVVISVAMCTSSYGQLLDRMLNRGGCGCEQATSCCNTPARGCGGSLLNLTINMPFSHCGGGCGVGNGFFKRPCGDGCGLIGGGLFKRAADCGCGAAPAAAPCNTGCDTGCDTGCGGGLLSGLGGFKLFNRMGCGGGCGGGCDACAAAAAPAADCGCGAPAADACGCGGGLGLGNGRIRGLFAGFGSRLGGCGTCGEATGCGCEAAPVAAPCDSGCNDGCGGGGLLSNLRGRIGNGCGCRVKRAPRTVCLKVPNLGLLDRLRSRGGCGCNDGCNISGCSDCGSGQAVPAGQPMEMQAVPTQAAPVEATPAVEPSVEPTPSGSGALNLPRTPVVDPNAFIIRGGKYTVNN